MTCPTSFGLRLYDFERKMVGLSFCHYERFGLLAIDSGMIEPVNLNR